MTLVWMKENNDEYFRLVINLERLRKNETRFAHSPYFSFSCFLKCSLRNALHTDVLQALSDDTRMDEREL
jgi:hypothetical protein